ncbi:DNA polymerase domain-containing protein [Edaphobacter flagellatus]|uniref:DNA polymerase domain-containing protein n=1 Tax=Edaphobacter flagellatus TaxID=1933044 RepID=UPI0021B48980|nr:DNA polymerase domain-containing protein [Edaphobacter flagellatus]
MSADEAAEILSIDGREVRVTHPGKLYFSQQVRVTKLDLVRYYLSVAPGALQGIRDRPVVLKRFVNGAEAEPFYQKRAPSDRPAWMRSVTLSFPSGRTAEEIVVDDAAGLAWIVNLGCMELHPHPVRTGDLDHPDELRVDLDPIPGVGWDDVRRVAMEVKAQLEEVGLRGWPKTSGSRGMHVNVRIEPRWTFTEVRRAAIALSRAVERRVPQLASSKWWKEERHGVFLDYNQNAKDRTTCSAYSVRPLPDARVSTPLEWDEVMQCDPAEFTIFTVPKRFAAKGDPHAAMDEHAGSLEALLELAARDEAAGLGDAPWPPHFRKMEGEAPRVAPSRAKKKSAADGDAQSDAPKRRQSKMPLLVIANSTKKDEALAGLERWKAKYPEAAALLAVDDVLVDSMRGSSSTWTRIRVNLRHVPEAIRPTQETPDPDDDPTRKWREWRAAGGDAPEWPRRSRKKKE